jgi:hypothetical protein
MDANGNSLDYLNEYGETYIMVTSDTAVAGQASLYLRLCSCRMALRSLPVLFRAVPSLQNVLYQPSLTPPSQLRPGGVSGILMTLLCEGCQFYAFVDCLPESVVDTSSVTAIDSGNVGSCWGPSNAFCSRAWKDEKYDQDFFWIGMDFADANVMVCIVRA